MRAAYLEHSTVRLINVVVDARARCDEIEVEFAFKTLLHHLHMQQAEEAYAEAEAERDGGLGRPDERRVVHMKLLERITQILVVLVIDGKDAGVDHGLRLAVPRQGLGTRAVAIRKGFAHMDRFGVFEAGDDESDLAYGEGFDGRLGGSLYADAVDEEAVPRLHHGELHAGADLAVEDTHRGDDTAILVEIRVENERFERRPSVSFGR